MEPLGSLASCCLAYSCVCEDLDTVRDTFYERGGTSNTARSNLFSMYMKIDMLSRCYWKLLPFRDVYWGR